MKQKFLAFMSGRYGGDNFGRFISIAALVIMIIGMILRVIFPSLTVLYYITYFLSLALLGYGIFRIMSRNTNKRFQENLTYLKCKNAVIKFFGGDKFKQNAELRKMRKADKDHVYEKCPYCKKVLRLPKVKGKHSVNCPCCHKSFGVSI